MLTRGISNVTWVPFMLCLLWAVEDSMCKSPLFGLFLFQSFRIDAKILCYFFFVVKSAMLNGSCTHRLFDFRIGKKISALQMGIKLSMLATLPMVATETTNDPVACFL